MAQRTTFAGLQAPSNDIAGRKTGQPVVSLPDLCLTYQVVLWSLRTYLLAPERAIRIRRQYERALPPAASRLAYRALGQIVHALRHHGKRSLKFHCLCKAELSPDEARLLAAMETARKGLPDDLSRALSTLVCEHGVASLARAMGDFLAALEAPRNCKDWCVPSTTLSAAIH